MTDTSEPGRRPHQEDELLVIRCQLGERPAFDELVEHWHRRLNVGGDVGFFFSRHVDVGGIVRFNKGTVTLSDPLTDEDVERDASHVSFGGGLRLRF